MGKKQGKLLAVIDQGRQPRNKCPVENPVQLYAAL
jgi:hypothetical protein